MTFSFRSPWRHAALYAGLIAVGALLTWAIVALVGNDPYHRKSGIISWVPTVYFIALALLTYRRRTDTEMQFSQGLGLGALTALLGAAASALALGLFALVTGRELINAHIRQALLTLEHEKAKLLALPHGDVYYPQVVEQTRHITSGALMVDDFLLRLVIGLIAALLSAILFRKANPLGEEPERPKRPAA